MYTFLVVLLVATCSYVASTYYEDHEPVPLREFVNVVKSFSDDAILAGHHCTVDTWTTKTGRLFVIFESKMTPDDVPNVLCNKFFNYINKNGWMTGVTGRCVKNGDTLSLTLEGEDDPYYDPDAAITPVPLHSLASVLRGGFKRAELGDYWTITKSYMDERGRVNILITIEAENENCVADDVCQNVFTYLNRPNILDNSTHTCKFIPGSTDKVLLHFLGNY